MRDLSIVMEQLRLVQRARRRFVELWTVEKDYINPMLDRMADDLQEVVTPANPFAEDDPGTRPALGDSGGGGAGDEI